MKKFLLSLALVAFAASASMAQTANVSQPQVKKECCKDHKDGQKCDKPADQQCDDCYIDVFLLKVAVVPLPTACLRLLP